jgi:PRTRC genetic system ThiF family protein
MTTFFTPSYLMQKHITVLLAGLGGTGSEVLSGLARLDHVMRATGHPYGLHVVAVDGDQVSAANIGRQPFCQSDIGQNKSVALVTRYCLHYGLRWEARPHYLKPSAALLQNDFDLLITAVDRAELRVGLAKLFQHSSRHRDVLWLDMGNDRDSAQVILGHLTREVPSEGGVRLPNVYDLYPELASVDDRAQPSCSVTEALRQQDLMVNRITADCGIQLLNRLFRHGRIEHHGCFIDLTRLSVRPLPIDITAWQCLGYQPRDHTRKKRAVAA